MRDKDIKSEPWQVNINGIMVICLERRFSHGIDLTSEHSEGVVANPYINIQNVNKASFYPKKVSKKNK